MRRFAVSFGLVMISFLIGQRLVMLVIVLRTGIRGQIIATASCLIVYWALMTFFSMPGFSCLN